LGEFGPPDTGGQQQPQDDDRQALAAWMVPLERIYSIQHANECSTRCYEEVTATRREHYSMEPPALLFTLRLYVFQIFARRAKIWKTYKRLYAAIAGELSWRD
jgi:hypothetical protein